MFNSQGENEASNNSNMCASQDVIEVPLLYNIHKSNLWDGKAHPISIFCTMELLDTDAKNMYTLLLHMLDFIKKKKCQLQAD